MNNQIAVINGMELMVKEYQGNRVVTAWDIAKLHNTTYDSIKKNFDNNKQYFAENEDYFLIEKQDDFASNLIRSKEIDHRVLNASKNIIAFTESGYLMMSKPLTGALAWAVQKQLVKNYFSMRQVREVVKEVIKESVKTLLTAEQAIESNKLLLDLAKAAGVGVESQMAIAKTLYSHAGIELPLEIKLDQKLFDLEGIARKIGILSINQKPHAQAVSEILKKVSVPEHLKVITFESKGNWQGSVTKFKEDVFAYVEKWLTQNNYPLEIEGDKKKFKVIYKKI